MTKSLMDDPDRPLRVCDLCGGVDKDPRHVLAGGLTGVYEPPSQDVVDKVVAAGGREMSRLLRDLYDTSSSDRHMDCCRTAGCPDGSCELVTAGAEDRRGGDLLEHLVAVRELATDTDEIVLGVAE
jgi:hypothetical protein